MTRPNRSRRPVSILLAAVLAVSLLPLSTAGAKPSERRSKPLKSVASKARNAVPGLDTPLLELERAAKAKGRAAAKAFGNRRGLRTDGEAVTVILEIGADEKAARKAVAGVGGKAEAAFSGHMRARVPVERLSDLAARPTVVSVRVPQVLVPETTSEGVAETNASVLQGQGVDGTGVKVGIIDIGFYGLSGKLGTELPSTVAKWGGGSLGVEGGFGTTDDHGLAVTEIVHDMAPGASLYLAQVQDEIEIYEAVEWMIGQGVTVVNMSLVLPGGGPCDGTGLENEIIDYAVDNGIFWANAAGNQGERHWSGDFVPTDNDFNLFGPDDDDQTFTATAGDMLTATLVWDDSWTNASQDYDLYLFHWNGSSWDEVTTSERIQDGSVNRTPEEYIRWEAESTGTYAWSIYRWEATETDVDFHLFDIYEDLEYQVAEESLAVPGDNASEGFMAVGAVGRAPGYALQSYSAQGPTKDGRIAPEIAAPDTVANSVTSPDPFSGTSAASPHLAGAAALVKQANPAYTPAAVEYDLETKAVDLGPAGLDNQYGHGRLWLPLSASDPWLPASPIGGHLSDTTPTAEYLLELNAGDDVTVGISRTSGDATVTVSLSTLAGAVITQTVESTLSHTATSTALYRVKAERVEAGASEADFQLDWRRVKAMKTEVIAAPEHPGWGKASTVYAFLEDAGGKSAAGSLSIYRSYDKKSWSKYKTLSVPSSGLASFSYTPSRRTYFQARYDGVTNVTKAAVSPNVEVSAKAYLTTPKAPSKVAKSSYFSATGYLKPRHATGTTHVKLQCYRYENGDWVLRKTASAKVSSYNSTTVKYTGRLALTSVGRWRIRAYVPADSLHTSTWSSYRYVNVSPTTLSIASDRSTTTYGISAKLSGVLRDLNGRALAYKPIALQSSVDGGKTWTHVRTVKTSSAGVARTSVKPTENTYYRFYFKGDYKQMASASAKKLIKPRKILLSWDQHPGWSRLVYLERGKAQIIWEMDDNYMYMKVVGGLKYRTILLVRQHAPAGTYYAIVDVPDSGYYTFYVTSADPWWIEIR